MGQYADDIIDGLCDAQGDYTYKYNGKVRRHNSTDTPAEANIRAVRREIAINIKNGMGVQEARKQANLKYGKGWRERGLIVNDDNQWKPLSEY